MTDEEAPSEIEWLDKDGQVVNLSGVPAQKAQASLCHGFVQGIVTKPACHHNKGKYHDGVRSVDCAIFGPVMPRSYCTGPKAVSSRRVPIKK